MNLQCTQCHANLPSEDATATHCRYCRAPLPHGEAAARQQAMMRDFMAQHAQPQVQVYAPPPGGAFVIRGGGGELGAMISNTVDRSMKMGLWITVATIGATFLITAAVMVVSFLR